MKNIRKLMSLLLALIMSLSLAIPCSAADDNSNLMWAWGFDSNGNKIPIIVDEIDDGSNDISLPSPQPAAYVMFTMYIKDMKHSIHTRDDKCFCKADLTNDYLKISGTIYTTPNREVGRVGLMYYDGGFYEAPEYTMEVNCGEPFEFNYSKSSFSPHYYYYGYAQSSYSGSVSYSGTVFYSDSAW